MKPAKTMTDLELEHRAVIEELLIRLNEKDATIETLKRICDRQERLIETLSVGIREFIDGE